MTIWETGLKKQQKTPTDKDAPIKISFSAEKDYFDAHPYKFFYEVKGNMSVGRRPSLFLFLFSKKKSK